MRLASGTDLASASRAHYKHTVFTHILLEENNAFCQAIDFKLYLVSSKYDKYLGGILHKHKCVRTHKPRSFRELVSINISSVLLVAKGCCWHEFEIKTV